MVLAACRRLLPDPHDADDAFQAVFLVLVRRASALLRRENLAGWLHEVAVRTARESRRREARRLGREARAAEGRPIESEPGAAEASARADELRGVIDEELHRLPGRYRMPVVLCDLEGRSRGEVAGMLGVAEGTLSSRLARGRGLLRERLTRRGLAPESVAGVAVSIAGSVGGAGRASAAVPVALERSAVASAMARVASGASGTVPAAVASLAQGVLRTMVLIKIKAGLAAIATVGVVAGLSYGLAGEPERTKPDEPAPSAVETPENAIVPAKPDDQETPGDSEKPTDWPVARGIVVDEQGDPVAGIHVDVAASPVAWASGETGADGRFAVQVRWPGWFGRTPNLWDAVVVASADDGRRLGFGEYPGRSECPGRGCRCSPGRARTEPRGGRAGRRRVGGAGGRGDC